MARGTSGALVVVALIVFYAGMTFQEEVSAQRDGSKTATGGELMTLTQQLPNGNQQVTLISPSQHVIGVYHIDSANGTVSLKSVRNIRWDLLLDEFNGNHPSPREIHALLNR